MTNGYTENNITTYTQHNKQTARGRHTWKKSIIATVTFIQKYSWNFYAQIHRWFYARRHHRKSLSVISASRCFSNGTALILPCTLPAHCAMTRPLILLLVLSAALGSEYRASSASAAAPSPCLAPTEWEGRWVQYDHSTGRNSRVAVSYDAPNQRLRLLQQHKKHTPCQRYFEFIYLYQSGVVFQIDQKTKECAKLPLSDPWDPFDIPDNSTFEDQYTVGGPGDNVEVQEWSDRKPARQHETWVGVYTVKDCYPVQETYTKNASVTTSTRFFDLRLGISDPQVFTPPSTCASARPRPLSHAHC